MSADPDERFNEICPADQSALMRAWYTEFPPRPLTDDEYAELQAESLAAADLDPDWPATYE